MYVWQWQGGRGQCQWTAVVKKKVAAFKIGTPQSVCILWGYKDCAFKPTPLILRVNREGIGLPKGCGWESLGCISLWRKNVCGGFIWSKRECLLTLFEFKRTVPFGEEFYLVTNFYGTSSFQRYCICLSIFFGGKQRDWVFPVVQGFYFNPQVNILSQKKDIS